MARGFLDMPEVLMSKIIKDIGIKSILTLRKVCHDIRNFIDDVKPEANSEGIEVSVRAYDSTICILYKFSGEQHYVEYQQKREGCSVRNFNRRKEILLMNEDVFTASMKDLEIVLGHQKSVLNELILTGAFEDNMDAIVLENLKRILSSRVHPLKVEKITVDPMNQNQLMSILPFLGSKTLSELDIISKESLFLVDQLVKLDHWKNIKQMSIRSLVDFEYIQHFTHISTDYLSFRATHFPDLVFLKDLFLQSSGFQTINVSPIDYNLDDVQQSTSLLGEPFLDVDEDEEEEEEEEEEEHRKKWFYRIPATTEVLEMSVYENSMTRGISIRLSRIDESEVPDEAVIQN